MGARKKGYEYPSDYGPEHGGDLAIAWDILDSIKPGVIPSDVRAFLAGQIVAELMKARGRAGNG